jgi:hypothetical protein
MIEVGTTQELRIARLTSVGAYVTDEEQDVLLPRRYVPAGADVDAKVRVFVYTDSEDRLVATTQRPKAQVGEFAYLHVTSVSNVGAFVDWGLDKDLLVPFSEQRPRMVEGRGYIVRVLRDEATNRVFGTMRLQKYLEVDASELGQGAPVEFLIADLLEDGARVIIENRFSGMLFRDEIIGDIRVGQKKQGFVKRVREDGRVSVATNPQGYEAFLEQGPLIIDMLKREGGFLPYSDNSSPDEIRRVFRMSKGAFKKVIGALFREGRIDLTHHGIRLLK